MAKVGRGTSELALEGKGGKEIPGEGTVFAEPKKQEAIGQGGNEAQPRSQCNPLLASLLSLPTLNFMVSCFRDWMPVTLTALSLLPLPTVRSARPPSGCWNLLDTRQSLGGDPVVSRGGDII